MKNLFKRVLSVAAATALLMTSVISASAHNHRDKDTEITGAATKYTITLTKPADVTVDTGAEYGAYQIFTGTVPLEDEDGYPTDAGAFTDPGSNGTKLPISDIKWGNAFGTINSADWKNNIVAFVKALAKPYTGTSGEYASAFKNFKGFENFVNEDNLADRFYPSTGRSNDDVNFDRLATEVADVIASHEDHEWLQAFADILGGYGENYSGSGVETNNKGFVTRYYKSAKNAAGNYEIKVPESGYYMILDRTNVKDEGEAYSARMLFVVNDITQELKEDVPTLEKKIVRDDDTEADTTVAGVGDEVTFKLTGTLPSNYDAYTLGYQYTFTDTLSSGLTPCAANKIVITVKGVYEKDHVNDPDYWNDTDTFTITTTSREVDLSHSHTSSNDAYIPTVTDQNIKVEFPCLREIVIEGSDGKKYVLGYNSKATGDEIKSSQIYVTYTAKVNEHAVVDPATGTGLDKDLKGNKNNAQLEYSDNPQAYGDTDKTTEQIATVYTFGLDITKIDAAAFIKDAPENKLDGAEFAILRKDTSGKYEYAKVTEMDTGKYAINSWSKDPDTITGTDGKTLRDALKDISSISIATNADGKFEITGLDAGVEYTLVEIKTPSKMGDYAFIDPITFTINAEEDGGEYTGKIKDITEGEGFSDGKKVSVSQSVVKNSKNETNGGIEDFTVVNFKYTDLPSTGGIGVYIYYIAGGCIVALAVVLFALSKKKKTTK